MGKIIALASGDWHFHDWKQFNETQERTQVTINFIFDLFTRAEKLKVPIWFTGDLFHTPKGLTTRTICTFNSMMNKFDSQFNIDVEGISGNHDIDKGLSLFQAAADAFPDIFKCIDNDFIDYEGFTLYGIPFLRRNIGLVDKIETMSLRISGKKVLLLHTELYGAPDPSGYEPTPQNLPRNLNALFKDFDLVLAGHIHKYAKVGKNIHMVGAPNQQRKSDTGCEMGYLEIYDDLSVKQVFYDAPGFRYYKEGEEHEDTNDFWIEIPKPKKIQKQSEAEFRPNMNKIIMAKRYAKETGVKSPKKINALINVLSQTDD